MYKASLDLGRINQHLKVTFNVVMKGDNQAQASKYLSETIDKFNYNGSTYLKFHPNPFITLDISGAGDKGEGWNPNMSVNLNKMALYEFNQNCEEIINAFQVKQLFYVVDKKLKLNTEISKNLIRQFKVGNKSIVLAHTVVTDTDAPNTEYEGVSMMINSVDNFALITYSEFKYLHHLLTNVNMDILSMELINAYIAMEKKKDSGKVREISLPKTLVNEPTDTESSVDPLPKTKEPHEIPDI